MHILFKTLIVFFTLFAGITCYSQQVLFFGTYKMGGANQSLTCVDRAIETRKIASLEEAEAAVKSFRSVHENQEPNTNIFSTGFVVIYQYDYKWESFDCTVKAFSWETGSSLEAARAKMNNNNDRKISGKREVYAWSSTGGEVKAPDNTETTGGITATFKQVTNAKNEVSSTLMTLTNPRADSAVSATYIMDGHLYKQTFVIEPGSKIQISLARFTNLELLVKPVEKGTSSQSGNISNLKGYLRKWFEAKQGGIEEKKPGSIGPRG